jgi:hypothetical protein
VILSCARQGFRVAVGRRDVLLRSGTVLLMAVPFGLVFMGLVLRPTFGALPLAWARMASGVAAAVLGLAYLWACELAVAVIPAPAVRSTQLPAWGGWKAWIDVQVFAGLTVLLVAVVEMIARYPGGWVLDLAAAKGIGGAILIWSVTAMAVAVLAWLGLGLLMAPYVAADRNPGLRVILADSRTLAAGHRLELVALLATVTAISVSSIVGALALVWLISVTSGPEVLEAVDLTALMTAVVWMALLVGGPFTWSIASCTLAAYYERRRLELGLPAGPELPVARRFRSLQALWQRPLRGRRRPMRHSRP